MNTTLLLTALVTGLAGSAHCLGMCGGIGASLGLSGKRHLPAYHAGRLLSYTLLGFVFGLLLPSLGLNASSRWPRILAAVIMFFTGLCLLFQWQPTRALERYAHRLWKPVATLTRHFIPARSHSDAFLLGLLWGLLPCGLIYNALALALSSAHPLSAAAVMFAFGLGTLPAMLALGFFSGIAAPWLRTSRIWLGFFIILCALWTLSPFFTAHEHHHHHNTPNEPAAHDHHHNTPNEPAAHDHHDHSTHTHDHDHNEHAHDHNHDHSHP